MSDDDLTMRALERRIQTLEDTKGQLGAGAVRTILSIAALGLSMATGALGLWAVVITSPSLTLAESNASTIERNNAQTVKDIERLERNIESEKMQIASLRDKVGENHTVMIDRTEALTKDIGGTLSSDVIAARFEAVDDQVKSLGDSTLRLVTGRLQPQIDRVRESVESVSGRVVKHLETPPATHAAKGSHK